jgi:hypothetical protein
LNPETFATYMKRLSINRNSAYSPPLWAEGLTEGLPGFDTRQCATGIVATLDPETPMSEAFQERVVETEPTPGKKKNKLENAEDLFKRIQEYAFAGHASTSEVPAPVCKQQTPFKPIYGSGPSTQYQHTFEQPQP